MSKFARGIKPGIRVKQGQTIDMLDQVQIYWTSFTL